MRLRQIAKIFLILAVATLFFRIGIVKPYTVMPFEFFAILSGITTAFSFIFSKTRPELTPLKPWFKLIIILIAFFIIGTANGYRVYGITPEIIKTGLMNFFYLGVSVLAFFLVIYYAGDLQFRQRMIWAFFIPLLYFPLIYLAPNFHPNVANILAYIPGKKGFFGFFSNQTYIALLLLMPLATIIVALIKAASLPKKIFWWMILVMIVSVLIWTGNRIGWVNSLIIALFIFVYQYFHVIRPKTAFLSVSNLFKTAGGYLAVFLFTVGVSFSILPSYVKVMSLDRIFPKITNQIPSVPHIIDKKITFERAVTTIINNPIPSVTNYQQRNTLWQEGINLFFKHYLLGIGLAYSEVSKAITEDAQLIQPGSSPAAQKEKRRSLVHSTPIQIALSGGIGALIVAALFAWQIIKKIKNAAEKNYDWLIAAAVMTGLIPSLIFDEPLVAAPLWIILALAVSLKQKISPMTQKTPSS